MQIYFYSGVLAKGGMETVLESVTNGLAALGHDVRVFAAGVLAGVPEGHFERALPGFHDLSRMRSGSGRRTGGGVAEFEQIMALQQALRSCPEPDLVVAVHTPIHNGIVKVATQHLQSRPLVVSWVHNPPARLPHPRTMQYADGHLAISSGIGEALQAMLPDRPVNVVYNPIPAAGGQIIPRGERPAFLYVGRLDNAQKRLDLILRALAEVREHDWRLHVIGSGVVTESEPMLRGMADSLGIADRIQWEGWTDRPWDRVREASALLLASDYEGFPVVIGEALARGVPVIASDCATGPADLVKPGENGWLFPPGDYGALAGLLRGVLTGTLPLPASEACIRSAAPFAPERVIRRIEETLVQYRRQLTRS